MSSARECANLLLETIPNLMRGLHGVLRQRKGADDEPHTMGQYRMLEMLHREPRTLSALAAMHHVTPSTMSRSIDVLVRKAWVARRHELGRPSAGHPDDHRRGPLGPCDDDPA